MRHSFYNDPYYKKKQSEITRQYWQLGRYNFLKKTESRICKNFRCSALFLTKPHDKKIYCGSSCAAIINNPKRSRFKRLSFCITCKVQLKRSNHRYCSNKCQNTYQYNLYISKWKKGLEKGIIGINTRFLSGHLERYLKGKYQNKCSICGWNQKNPVTGVTPLEINHINGNAENNKEENLELLCPNCHALTPNFRNLNKGNGREWRLSYLKTRKHTESPKYS